MWVVVVVTGRVVSGEWRSRRGVQGGCLWGEDRELTVSWGRGWGRGGRCVVGGHLIAGDGQMERASPQGGTTLGIVSPRVRVV